MTHTVTHTHTTIETVDENNSKTIEFGEFLSLMASETWSEIEKSEIIKVSLNSKSNSFYIFSTS